MKIRTQLLMSAVLAVFLGVAAALAVWWFVVQFRDADRERDRAGAAARDTANLLVLTQEFALHFDERARQQWQERHASLGTLLHSADNDRGDRQALEELRRASMRLPPLFARLGDLAQASPVEFTHRRKEFLVDQLLTETQALVDGAYRWSREAAAAQRNAERNLESAMAAALGLIAVLMLVQMAVLARRVVRPVLRLREAVQAVERGESRVQVEGQSKDEIGELGRGFNAMTEALAQRTEALAAEIALRQQAQALTQANEKRLLDITNNLPVLISYVDASRRLQFANATFKEWFGVDPDHVIGRDLLDVIGPALLGQRQDHLDRALRGERVSFELVSEANGVRRHLQNVYVPDVRPDGSVAGLHALSSDVTAIKLVEKRLHELARVDELTGLPNRRQFEEKLAQAVARSRRENRPMALLFLDVDRFKQINDQHGHGVGDEVLKEFSQRLRRCVRLTDTVARLAGDEFVIILEGLRSSVEAEQVARKIGSVLSPPFAEAAMRLSVSSSIGVAFVDGQDVSPDEIIAKADKALYQAKRAGRATFAVSTWNTDDGGGSSATKPSTIH